MGPRAIRRRAVLAVTLMAAGCVPSAESETAALTLSPDALRRRDAQARRFETPDAVKVLGACAALYQDLGFLVEEGSSTLGYLVGSKLRDATQAQDVALQMLLVAIAAAGKQHYDPVWDAEQRIRLATTARSTADHRATIARVTFQRVLRNNKGLVSGMETMEEPALYQQFFDRLAQSLFLNANAI